MIRIFLKNLIANIFFFTIKIKIFKKFYFFFFQLFLINRGYCANWEYLINKSSNKLFNGENLFIKKLHKIGIKKCIDVGANIGEYSEQLIVNNIKEVLAFEPLKENLAKLKKLEKKYPNQFKFYNYGLSNKNKIEEIVYKKGKSEQASLEIKSIFKKNKNKKEMIKLKKLDNHINNNNFKNIDLIKIDVEGHELKVIQGSMHFIKKNNVKIIQIEFNWHHLFSKTNIFDISNNLKDYDIFMLNLLSGKLIKVDPKDYLSNIFMLSNFVFIKKKLNNYNALKILF